MEEESGAEATGKKKLEYQQRQKFKKTLKINSRAKRYNNWNENLPTVIQRQIWAGRKN